MGPIGVFDSGYGGLTILDGIRQRMPGYDYIYLGDNARAPYGTRSFDVVYEFTLQAVKKLFEMGCPLVILGCNTASAKALRSIQQKYLPQHAPDRRVLGVIRPTAEVVGELSHTKHIGVLATEGTIKSESYNLEIEKLHPDCTIVGQACPMWVPLVENNEFDKPGADYFVRDSLEKLMAQDPLIDTIILGCTHYPLLLPKIEQQLRNVNANHNPNVDSQPSTITLVPQGQYIASSLEDYLRRHPEMDARLTRGGTCQYLTTESATKFRESASLFLHEEVEVQRITLN
jgi:glutamate racemase